MIFIIPGFYLIKALWSLKNNVHLHPVQISIFILLYLSGAYIIYLKYYSNVASPVFTTGLAMDAFLYQLFPLILFFSSLDIKMISKIMDKTSIIFIWVASLYIIIQYILIFDFNFLTPMEIKSWLKGYPVQSNAIPGFQGTIQASSMTLIAFTIYFLIRTLMLNNRSFSWRNKIFLYSTLLISHYAVSLSYSITNSVILISSTLLILFIAGFINKKIIYTSILSIPFVTIFYFSSVLGKLKRYIGTTQFQSGELTYREMVVDKFILIANNCDIKLHTEQQSPSFCSFGEWHVLSATANHGLIPDLPRLLMIFLPIVLFILIFKNKRYEQYPLAAFCLILLAGSIHYPNLANWPNVFIYQVIVVALIKYNNFKLERIQG